MNMETMDIFQTVVVVVDTILMIVFMMELVAAEDIQEGILRIRGKPSVLL